MGNQYIQNEILSVAKKLGIIPISIDSTASELLKEEIIKKYSSDKRYHFPLWHQLSNSCSLYDPNGWRKIDQFNTEGEIMLFVESESKFEFYVFSSLFLAKKIIENSFGFVFYLTNKVLDFVICFNDHDYLIATGKAKEWLKGIKEKTDQAPPTIFL